eukprot:COSAG01_NODE_7008_length_3394_cov_3.696813_2_plen_47_part_00
MHVQVSPRQHKYGDTDIIGVTVWLAAASGSPIHPGSQYFLARTGVA